MAKIDPLFARMVQSKASRALLESDQPVRVFAGGGQVAGAVMSSMRLKDAIREITPANLCPLLEKVGNFHFCYESPHGDFHIAIANFSGVLHVAITPAVQPVAATTAQQAAPQPLALESEAEPQQWQPLRLHRKDTSGQPQAAPVESTPLPPTPPERPKPDRANNQTDAPGCASPAVMSCGTAGGVIGWFLQTALEMMGLHIQSTGSISILSIVGFFIGVVLGCVSAAQNGEM